MRNLHLKPELKISFIYIIVGFIWILASGRITLLITNDIHTINLIETYKGWFFISLTGILIYFLIKKDIKKRNIINKQLKESIAKAEEANQLKSAFLLNISHEIRTPLNAILGFSDLLNKRSLPIEKRNTYNNYIKQRGLDLLQVIDNLIDISKIDADIIEISKKDFFINELIDELFKFYSDLISADPQKNIKLVTHKSIENNFKIYTDRQRIKQIFINLLNNAYKFTDDGIIEFGYNLSDQKLTFFVFDSGVGIPSTKADFVFERFVQLGNSLTKKHSGLGIGLSISKKLVEKLNGNIWFESEENKGTKFYFEFPLMQLNIAYT